MINEAIILAGGLGTRLRSAVPGLPKCMAPVAGKPFLFYIVEYLKSQGIKKFIFSLGYMHETVEQYINLQYPLLDVQYSIEKEPLGTGGAIKMACNKSAATDIFILNGDTFFSVDMGLLSTIHKKHQSDCTLCLKPMQNFDRYGIVVLDSDNSIQSFKEKQPYHEGLINGGIYALNISSFQTLILPEKFSFEKEYLEKYYMAQKMYGLIQNEYFIDIGIPEDYKRAQVEF